MQSEENKEEIDVSSKEFLELKQINKKLLKSLKTLELDADKI